MTLLTRLSLNHVAILVSDLARSVTYNENLGLRHGIAKRCPENGDHLVQLKSADGNFVKLIGSSNRLVERARGQLGVAIDDTTLTYTTPSPKELAPPAAPQMGTSGVRWFFLSDPNGNKIEFTARDRDI